jgi:hypothetical protein
VLLAVGGCGEIDALLGRVVKQQRRAGRATVVAVWTGHDVERPLAQSIGEVGALDRVDQHPDLGRKILAARRAGERDIFAIGNGHRSVLSFEC